jgi:hypothetical protein
MWKLEENWIEIQKVTSEIVTIEADCQSEILWRCLNW